MWAMPAQRPCWCRFEEVFTVATLRSALRSCIPGVGARAGTPFSADYGRILRTRSRAIVPIQTHDAALSRDWFREGGLSKAMGSVQADNGPERWFAATQYVRIRG